MKSRTKSKTETNSSLEKKLYDTTETNLDDDLKLILNEADKVTMHDLEFDKIFNEQSKILCDIKTLLQNEKTGKTSVKTSLDKCNLFANKDNKKLQKLLHNYRHKYTMSKQNAVTANASKENELKKEGKTRKTSRKHSKPKRTTKSKKHSKAKRTKSINKKKVISKDLNLNYPIVFLKNKKPYKNVIMIKNDSKNREE